eukprot:3634464-Pyramimonas_sp.AAC.1
MISDAVFAQFGVVVGCSLATTMIRISSIGPLDKIAWSPHVDFKLYIDSSSIAAVGTHREVVSGVVEGARALQSAAAETGATLSADKAILICSSKAVGLEFQDSLGIELSGPLVKSGVNLGVGDTQGTPFRHQGKNARTKRILAEGNARSSRLGKFGRV